MFSRLGYAIAQLGRIELHRRYKDQEWSIAGVSVHELAKTAADILRQWAHVDVVAIAAMVHGKSTENPRKT